MFSQVWDLTVTLGISHSFPPTVRFCYCSVQKLILSFIHHLLPLEIPLYLAGCFGFFSLFFPYFMLQMHCKNQNICTQLRWFCQSTSILDQTDQIDFHLCHGFGLLPSSHSIIQPWGPFICGVSCFQRMYMLLRRVLQWPWCIKMCKGGFLVCVHGGASACLLPLAAYTVNFVILNFSPY